jgi:hypothetical protein
MAAAIRRAASWSTQLVHGLLQTEDYARALIGSHGAWLPITPPGTIRRLVEVRLTRQRRVTGDCSPALTVVLDSTSTRRPRRSPTGGPSTSSSPTRWTRSDHAS